MESREPRVKQRILIKMVHDMKLDAEEIVRVMAAFDDLSILKKRASDMMRLTNKRTFELNKEKYKEKMKWINDYVKLQNTMEEDIFTNCDSFEISSDDYDYYYERKTPTQYREEEEARKAKKLGTKPARDGREPGDE